MSYVMMEIRSFNLEIEPRAIRYAASRVALVIIHLLLSAYPSTQHSSPVTHASRYSILGALHPRYHHRLLGKRHPDFRQWSSWQKPGLGEMMPHVLCPNFPLA